MDRTAIRVQRALRDMSVTELAKRAGVSRFTAYRWEHGRANVSEATAARLTKALLEPHGVRDVPAQITGR